MTLVRSLTSYYSMLFTCPKLDGATWRAKRPSSSVSASTLLSYKGMRTRASVDCGGVAVRVSYRCETFYARPIGGVLPRHFRLTVDCALAGWYIPLIQF